MGYLKAAAPQRREEALDVPNYAPDDSVGHSHSEVWTEYRVLALEHVLPIAERDRVGNTEAEGW